jgi:hypothetical protein
MDIQSKKAALKGQQATLAMDHSSAETTLRYLQEQKEEAVVFYAVGRMYVLLGHKIQFCEMFTNFLRFLTCILFLMLNR